MRRSSILYASAIHVLLLAALLLPASHTPRIAPTRLPGTVHGLDLLTYYSPGGAPAQSTSTLQKIKPHTVQPAVSMVRSASATAAQTPAAPTTEAGTGVAGPSGLGQGNITIAMQKFFPPPHPDLSTIASGSAGDVIVDATIDAQGNITQLTLIRGLSDPINNAVLATVRQWTYSPATRDGLPIPSEQELLFHFQRG